MCSIEDVFFYNRGCSTLTLGEGTMQIFGGDEGVWRKENLGLNS